MNKILIKNKINNYIENLDFDNAYNLYMNNKTTKSLQKDLVKFLYDIGDISSLYEVIQNDNGGGVTYDLLEYNGKILTKNELLEKLRFHLDNDKNILYEKMLSAHYVNPNFLLQQYIKDDSLNNEIAINIFKQQIKWQDIRSITKVFFAKIIFDYLCKIDKNRQIQFSVINGSQNSVLLNTLGILNRQNKLVSNKYYAILLDLFKQCLLSQCDDNFKNLLPKIDYKPPKQYKKIAICLYGILRGDYIATLQDIIDNLAKPLNADVFLFTWEDYQMWAGMCGWQYWARRIFDASIYDKIPLEIYYNHELKRYFPNVYNKIIMSYLAKVDTNKLEKLIKNNKNFKCYKLENQEKSQYIGKDIGLGYHLYYGVYQSVEIMKEYEKEHNIEYDFIFSMRSDGDIEFINASPDKALQSIHKIANNEICDTFFEMYPGNIPTYGTRDCILAFANLYNLINLLPSNIFHIIEGNHDTTFLYLTLCGVVRNKDCIISQQYALGNKCQKGYCFPDISKELEIDMKNLKIQNVFNKYKMQSFIDAFNKISSLYPYKPVTKITTIHIKAQAINDAESVVEEEYRFLKPNDFLFILKFLKFLGKIFPNRKIRKKIRNFTYLFKFTYKKIYGISID